MFFFVGFLLNIFKHIQVWCTFPNIQRGKIKSSQVPQSRWKWSQNIKIMPYIFVKPKSCLDEPSLDPILCSLSPPPNPVTLVDSTPKVSTNATYIQKSYDARIFISIVTSTIPWVCLLQYFLIFNVIWQLYPALRMHWWNILLRLHKFLYIMWVAQILPEF